VIVVDRAPAPPCRYIIVIVIIVLLLLLLLFLLFSLSFLFNARTTPAHEMYFNDTKIIGGLHRLAIEAAVYWHGQKWFYATHSPRINTY